jgi:hypothetical protein
VQGQARRGRFDKLCGQTTTVIGNGCSLSMEKYGCPSTMEKEHGYSLSMER